VVHTLLVAAAALVYLSPPASANSSGAGPACFDALTLCHYPCPTDDEGNHDTTLRPWDTEENGHLCCPPGMDLVAPPNRSTDYAVSVLGNSSTTYAPEELLTIAVDVLSPRAKYLGLLLYAVADDGSETKVGAFELLTELEEPKFWTPPSCENAAVMHANAGTKDYHHTFPFRAPPAGTGPIRFRALVKHGETNGGAFYWPGEQDLLLEEADLAESSSPMDDGSVTTWLRGDEGASCAEACIDSGLACDSSTMLQANIESGPGRFFPCRTPLLSNNGESCDRLDLVTTADGFCSFRNIDSEDSTACNLASPVDLCEAKPAMHEMRFCACKAFPNKDEDSPFLLTDDDDVNPKFSGAARIQPGTRLSMAATTLAITTLTASSVRREGAFVAILSSLALALTAVGQPALAHNWMNNPSTRVAGLSKMAPAPPRAGNNINFAVRQGEDFHLEWSTGHPNSFVYFTFVRSEDEGQLGLATEAALEDYLAQAPAETNWLPDNHKTHVRWTAPLPTADTDFDGAPYTRLLTNDDPAYFERPDNWRCSRRPPAGGCNQPSVTYGQYEYESNMVATDKRAAYENPAYPWIVAVARYKIVYRRPQDYDLAKLQFPDDAPPGDYIIQYQWRGYYDAMDVLLVEDDGDAGGAPLELVTEYEWIKTDHCQYRDLTFNNNKYDCFVLPSDGNASALMDYSDAMTKNSYSAISIVPLVNPPEVRFKDDINMPFNNRRCKRNVLEAEAAQREDEHVLVGVAGHPGATPEVGEPYVISMDPRDPVFYSTCYRRESTMVVKPTTASRRNLATAKEPTPSMTNVNQRLRGSANVAPDNDLTGSNRARSRALAETKTPRWRFSDACISCEDAVAATTTGFDIAPSWHLATECKRCDLADDA